MKYYHDALEEAALALAEIDDISLDYRNAARDAVLAFLKMHHDATEAAKALNAEDQRRDLMPTGDLKYEPEWSIALARAVIRFLSDSVKKGSQ